MDQLSDKLIKAENTNLPPSSLEFIIFPELEEDKNEGLELDLEDLLQINFETNYTKFPNNLSVLNPKIARLDKHIFEIDSNIKPIKYMSEDAFENEEIENEEKEKIKTARKKKQIFIYYLFLRLLHTFSIISQEKQTIITIAVYKDKKMETLINEDHLSFRPSDLNSYLCNIKKLEALINKIISFYTVSSIIKQPHLKSLKTYHLSYNRFFDKVKLNYKNKFNSVKLDWIHGDQMRQITNYENDFKVKFYKSKIKALLNDKILFKHLMQSYAFNNPKLFTKKSAKLIFRIIKKNKVIKFIGILIKKLIKRRKLLWKSITLSMIKSKFLLIGKDYKIYRKRLAKTYISQTNKYVINLRKRIKLNAKHIKCIEFVYTKKLMRQFRRMIKQVLKINLHLRYFASRFYNKFIKYKRKIFDKKFVVPVKGKILNFDEILDILVTCRSKKKVKIFNTIIYINKHNIEKKLLKSIQKLKQSSLESYINILEKEKYYPKYRRTRFNPKIKKWLMKHVNEELNLEFREYFSRPRVILEKREEEVEVTYPYLPRDPLKFQRDLDAAEFKKNKFIKYHIIRLTRPWIALQSKYFNPSRIGSKTVSKTLLRSKLNSKLDVPERVQRINRSCKNFYKNFLQDHSYTSFIKLIIRLKALFLFKPHLIKSQKYIITYLLSLIVSPIFRGISEEREYAHQLQVFLTNFLIRIRPYRRFNLNQSIYRIKRGYIYPRPDNLKFFRKITTNAKRIINKKPNYIFMKHMYYRSLKRLTIRMRSKMAVVRGLGPLFKYNLIATDACSPINIKKNLQNKGYHYLFQPDLNSRAKAKYKYYITALKRTYGYSVTFHTNAKFYYFSPYNLFLKNLNEVNLSEVDRVAKYQSIINSKPI